MAIRVLKYIGIGAILSLSLAAQAQSPDTPPPSPALATAPVVEKTAPPPSPSPPPTTTPVVEVTASPPIQPPAPVIAPARDLLAEAAITYGSFHSDAGQYRRTFQSADEIAQAAEVLGTHNPEKLASGWIAYSALLASQSVTYANEVRETDAFYGRDRLMLGLNNDVSYSLTLKGADDALRRALQAGKADARRLNQIGSGITYQARGPLQSLGWAKAKLRGNSDKFVTELETKSLAGRPNSAAVRSVFDIRKLNSSLQQATTLGSSTSLWDRMPGLSTTSLASRPVSSGAFATYQPSFRKNRNLDFLHGRITTLAAYKILGETSETSTGLAKSLSDKEVVTNLSVDNCVKTAQLQYRGCVVGNYFVFERAFCIGQHAVSDIGQCINQVTN